VVFGQAVPERHGRAQQGELHGGVLVDGGTLVAGEGMAGAVSVHGSLKFQGRSGP